MIENAKWITAGEEEHAPCIVKKFHIENAQTASLYITGLGYFIAKINGKNVTEDLFNPVHSDYRERDFSKLLYPFKDETTHRVYYCKYNVEKLLKNGENTLEVYLGNGWYFQDKRTAEGHLEFGKGLITKFVLQVTDGNGTVTELFSDGTEKWRATEVVENNIFYGETHDWRRLERNTYKPVTVEPEFATSFTLQTCPAERIIRRIKPTLVKAEGNRKIYDAGETVSGWVKIKAKGRSGDKITVVNHSEILKENGDLQVNTVGGGIKNDNGELQAQRTTYVLDGKTRYYHPKFSRQCFRYFEIEGEFISLTVELVHTYIPERTTFSCDNEVLNWLYEAYKRTQAVNMHDGFPSDCPHRERLGYTGDGQITASAAMTFFDCKEFYRKWIRDIFDCQDIHNGHVQHTAPFYGGGGGPVGWGGAIVQVPYAYYLHYGDKELVNAAMPPINKWISYIKSRTENGLVCKEEEGGWCLGDWAAIDGMTIPQEFVNTALFVYNLQKVCFLMQEIGQDASEYANLAQSYKKSIVSAYYNAETHSFCDGVQAADAFALSIGLGDEMTKRNLIERYTDMGYFDTGFLGTYQLIEYLLNVGEEDLAFNLLASKKRGSFGHMMIHGGNTIFEYLKYEAGSGGSMCHPMFGGVAEFLPRALLGFPVNNDGTRLTLSPVFPRNVNRACGSMTFGGRKASVFWRRKGETVYYQIRLPKGYEGTVVYNGDQQIIRGTKTIKFKQEKK